MFIVTGTVILLYVIDLDSIIRSGLMMSITYSISNVLILCRCCFSNCMHCMMSNCLKTVCLKRRARESASSLSNIQIVPFDINEIQIPAEGGREELRIAEISPRIVDEAKYCKVVDFSQIQVKQCIICFDNFDKEKECVQLICNPLHVFHRTCIQLWIKENPNCPICRTELLPRRMHIRNLDNLLFTGFILEMIHNRINEMQNEINNLEEDNQSEEENNQHHDFPNQHESSSEQIYNRSHSANLNDSLNSSFAALRNNNSNAYLSQNAYNDQVSQSNI